MGKEFIEYHSENETIPYKVSTICSCLTDYARNYIKEDRDAISNIDEDVRDAVLVDAINNLGTRCFFDYALYTDALYEARNDKVTVDSQMLLTIVLNYYTEYMFKFGIVDSVLRNNYMNNCRKKFDGTEGATVLVDFINYIAQVNDYDRKFTIKDLYEKQKNQDYQDDIKKLREFLEKTARYSDMLNFGISIDSIYYLLARKYHLKNISEDGTYYYTDEFSKKVGHSEIRPEVKKDIEDELYAMAYAYEKMISNYKEPSHIEEINRTILEMKKR